MAYKQPSTGPFKMMGSSPAKKATDPKAIKGKHYPDKATVQKLKTGPYAKGGQNAQTTTPKGFNTKGGKTTTPGYSTTKGANKGLSKNFNSTGSSKAGKLAKVSKFLGRRALGVLGLLGTGTLSASATPTDKQKNQNQFKKPDFKAINKDLAKSMYKPLPKNK